MTKRARSSDTWMARCASTELGEVTLTIPAEIWNAMLYSVPPGCSATTARYYHMRIRDHLALSRTCVSAYVHIGGLNSIVEHAWLVPAITEHPRVHTISYEEAKAFKNRHHDSMNAHRLRKALSTPVPLEHLLWTRSLGGEITYSDLRQHLTNAFKTALGPRSGKLADIIPLLESFQQNAARVFRPRNKYTCPEMQSTMLAGGLVTRAFHMVLKDQAPGIMTRESLLIDTSLWRASDIDLWCSHDYLPRVTSDYRRRDPADPIVQVGHLIRKLETAMGNDNIAYRATRSMLELKSANGTTVQLLKARPSTSRRIGTQTGAPHEATWKAHRKTVRNFDLSVCQCAVRFEPNARYYVSPLGLYGLLTGTMAIRNNHHNCSEVRCLASEPSFAAFSTRQRARFPPVSEYKLGITPPLSARTMKYVVRGFTPFRNFTVRPTIRITHVAPVIITLSVQQGPSGEIDFHGNEKFLLELGRRLQERTLERRTPEEVSTPSVCGKGDYNSFDRCGWEDKCMGMNFLAILAHFSPSSTTFEMTKRVSE